MPEHDSQDKGRPKRQVRPHWAPPVTDEHLKSKEGKSEVQDLVERWKQMVGGSREQGGLRATSVTLVSFKVCVCLWRGRGGLGLTENPPGLMLWGRGWASGQL